MPTFIYSKPVYTLTGSSVVSEGTSILFTVTANVSNGTVLYWNNAGTTTAADFAENTTSGSLTITNGVGTITLTILSDAVIESNETIILELRELSVSGPIVATQTVTINDIVTIEPTVTTLSQSGARIDPTASVVNESGRVDFVIRTTGISDGTTLYWNNIGTTSASDFFQAATNGSFVVNSNQGIVRLNLFPENTTEGNETIIFQVRSNSIAGPILAQLYPITVADTSRPPVDAILLPTSTPNSQTFNFTGGIQTFNVGVTTYFLRVTATGGSGGSGINGAVSGAGGRIVGWIAVTPGESLNIIVGGGGAGRGPSASSRYGGGGGGFSGVMRGTTHLISAGGGGGSCVIDGPSLPHGTKNGGGALNTAADNFSLGSGGISRFAQLNGFAATAAGGGAGGDHQQFGSVQDSGGGGGGGSYGSGLGTGGGGSDGLSNVNFESGRGGNGGFGGGGGGGGGGFGSNNDRQYGGGGGGGGYRGGNGGDNNASVIGLSGGGGSNFIKELTNPYATSQSTLITNTAGGGAAAVSGAGANGNSGQVIIQW